MSNQFSTPYDLMSYLGKEITTDELLAYLNFQLEDVKLELEERKERRADMQYENAFEVLDNAIKLYERDVMKIEAIISTVKENKMNNQTIKVAASHNDHINRVIQGNHIQPGNMIDYLESRLHYIQCSGLDLKHEVEMGLAETVEPGFYEKLFAELDAEIDMVKSIIDTLKGGAMESAPNQTTLDDVINYLEYVQLSTTEDISIFGKEIKTPEEINNNEAAQAHFKMLLDVAETEQACLSVVIDKLKDDLEGDDGAEEVVDGDETQEVMNIFSEERQAKDEVFLEAIRKRRAELMKGGV